MCNILKVLIVFVCTEKYSFVNRSPIFASRDKKQSIVRKMKQNLTKFMVKDIRQTSLYNFMFRECFCLELKIQYRSKGFIYTVQCSWCWTLWCKAKIRWLLKYVLMSSFLLRRKYCKNKMTMYIVASRNKQRSRVGGMYLIRNRARLSICRLKVVLLHLWRVNYSSDSRIYLPRIGGFLHSLIRAIIL